MKTTKPVRPCSVCRRGPSGLFRGKLNPVVPCLGDANDRHHVACRNSCDVCVAAARVGGRRR